MGDLRSAPETLSIKQDKFPNFYEEENSEHNESENTHQNRRASRTILQRISFSITNSLENFFFRWGYTVAEHPYKFITICLLFTVISATGFYGFKQEIRPDKLILPSTSPYAINTEWLRTNSPVPVRENHALIRAKNVLVPEVMKILMTLHETVENLSTKEGKKWKDVCFRLPITKFGSRRRKRSLNSHDSSENAIFGDSFEDAFSDDFFNFDIKNSEANLQSHSEKKDWDPYANVPEELYCSLIESLDDACWEINPAELWSFDKSKSYNMTQDDIIWFFNHQLESPVFGRPVNYTQQLGGEIIRNDKGEIISAESILLQWYVAVDKTGEIVADEQGQLANADSLRWEKIWIDAMADFAAEMPDDINLYYINSRSWGDISQSTLKQEGIMLVCGYAIMFVYVGVMLGKLNWVEQRPFLTGAGLTSILFSLIVSCGISSFFSIPFMTLNRILPFLMLGIGIDDMFVISQTWNNLFPNPLEKKRKLTIPLRMGFAMKHAGVSVTITSVTDVAAFAAGALTTLPSLRSFCIYAAIGMIALFIFQCTFFVACFAIDQKRLEERRNAYVFCIKYSEDKFVPNSSKNSKSYCQLFFDKILSKYLFKKPVMVVVVFVTSVFFGISVYGNTLLTVEFSPWWFIPDSSYMVKYILHREQLFPTIGTNGIIVAHEVNWSQSLNQFEKFVDEFTVSDNIHSFQEWFGDFQNFSMKYYGLDIVGQPMTPQKWDKYMGKYLYSPTGARHRYFFSFNDSFACGDSLPHITTVIIPFKFKKFNGVEEHLPALRWIKSVTANANMTFNDHAEGKFFFWGASPLGWEIDEIIQDQLYRNLSLSLVCVICVTLFLLADFKLCFLCGTCVILTITEVGGYMHFWNLTINAATCTLATISVGLSVDYAAHICLAFMKCQGTKTQRAQQAVKNIGPAVFNGAFSTFLGVILLANAQTRVVESFFKMFTMVVFFGLFNGLIFLPILLSLFGSESHPSEDNDEGQLKNERKSDGDVENQKQNQKVVEMYPLSNGHSHAKEREARCPETNGMLNAGDPLLTHADSSKH